MDSRKDDFGRLNKLNEENFDGGRPNKFLYKGTKHKSDPWSTENGADEFEGLIQPNTSRKNNKRTNNSPGFDFEDVWSIRKNVQVSTAAKNGSALKTTNKSFYSRHGGIGGNGESDNITSITKRQKREDPQTFSSAGTDSKTWSVARSGYSYSDRFSNSNNNSSVSPLRNEFDDPLDRRSDEGSIEDDFVTRKNKLNTKLHMAGAPQIATREMSARTKKAHNLQQAHLKSCGLGQYSASGGQCSKQTEDENVKWKRDDFL